MTRLHRFALPLLAGLLVVAMPARAFNHNGLWPENHLCGPTVRPSDLSGKVTVVVDWSIDVPESLAWLKLFNLLAREHAQDPRVLFITSYVRGTPKETVLALSKASANHLPTYRDLSLVDVVKCGGAHYAYIGDQTGKIVWAQPPKTDLSDLKAALRQTLAAIPPPTPGSIIDGMALKVDKTLPRRLMIGRNIENTLLRLRAQAKRTGAAAEEAVTVLERCEAWSTEQEAALRKAIRFKPSQALLLARTYLATRPSRADTFREELTAAAQDPFTKRLAAARQELAKLRTAAQKATPPQRERLLRHLGARIQTLSSLRADNDHTEDWRDVCAAWQTFAAELMPSPSGHVPDETTRPLPDVPDDLFATDTESVTSP